MLWHLRPQVHIHPPSPSRPPLTSSPPTTPSPPPPLLQVPAATQVPLGLPRLPACLFTGTCVLLDVACPADQEDEGPRLSRPSSDPEHHSLALHHCGPTPTASGGLSLPFCLSSRVGGFWSPFCFRVKLRFTISLRKPSATPHPVLQALSRSDDYQEPYD